MNTLHLPRPLRQRGVASIIGLFWIGAAVVCLLAIDLGYVAWQKRELQRIADLAALAGAASTEANCASNAIANATQSNGLTKPGDKFREPPQCGNWDSQHPDGSNPPQYFIATPTPSRPFNAARVTVERNVGTFFGLGNRPIYATATAARSLPRAVLSIRSTLVNVNDGLLNSLVGGLLGGSINVSLIGWQGIANTKINLLSFLDQLAINLNLTAGQYDELIKTDVGVGDLLQAAIDALQRSGNTAQATVDAIAGLIQLRGQLPAGLPLIKLADLLQVASGTPAAGLDLGLDLFQLVQGFVQVANGKNAVVASVPITVPGVGAITVKTKVIEPAQISAIGNPALAKLDPMGENRIFVRTAQIRTLISIELKGLTGVLDSLLQAVLNQLAPLTSFVNEVLNLNLVTALGNFLNGLLCGGLLGSCPQVDAIYAKVLSAPRLDIGLNVGGGRAHVEDFSCTSKEEKTLTVAATTAVAELQIGQIAGTPAAEQAFFSAVEIPEAASVPLVEIGRQKVRPDSCVLTLCSGLRWKKGSGWTTDQASADFTLESALGLKADTTVGGTPAIPDLLYVAPAPGNLPDISSSTPTPYKPVTAENIVGSLSDTLANVDIQAYRSPSSGTLGNLLHGTISLINNLITSLRGVIKGVLSPLLDPLLNSLLKTLGVNVATTEVGARLTCNSDVELVY